jgi:uncharacterized membrane protein YbhN (UPF0104 family)
MNGRKVLFTTLKIVLPLLLGIYLIWVFFDGMSPKEEEAFYRAILNADYVWIFLSLILGVLSNFSRAYRWKYVLEPLGHKTSFWNRYHAVMIGYLVNLTIPRAGEASRSGMLYRSDGVPFSASFGTIIAERAVDAVVLLGIALLTAFMGLEDFMEIKHRIELEFFGDNRNTTAAGLEWKWLFYGIALIALVIFTYLFIFKPTIRAKLLVFIKGVFDGVFSIFKSTQPLGYIFHTLFIWACYIVMFALPFQSLEQTSDVSFVGILLGFIAGSLVISFTNGGIGSYPLVVGLVVAFYIGKDYPKDAQAIGNALGMLVWVTQTLLMIILGLLSLWMLPNNFSKEDESRSSNQA